MVKYLYLSLCEGFGESDEGRNVIRPPMVFIVTLFCPRQLALGSPEMGQFFTGGDEDEVGQYLDLV